MEPNYEEGWEERRRSEPANRKYLINTTLDVINEEAPTPIAGKRNPSTFRKYSLDEGGSKTSLKRNSVLSNSQKRQKP